MSKRRATLTSAVYEERVVVSCGTDIDGGDVEVYDIVSDAWSPMPSMISNIYGQSSFAVRNKLL